jgi:hypothetical protein
VESLVVYLVELLVVYQVESLVVYQLEEPLVAYQLVEASFDALYQE